MSDENHQTRRELGRNMELAFDYIQQVFRETAQLMVKLDDLMGANWMPTYGNRTTKEVTSHLGQPDDWLVRASFRIYDSPLDPGVRKGITVAYWGNGIEEPILIGGRLDYVLAKGSAVPEASDHWDLRQAWFEAGPEDKRIDGTVYRAELEEASLGQHVEAAQVFAIPLVSIESEDDIRTEVYDRLIDL